MSIPIYDQSIGAMRRMLQNLDRIVGMAEDWVAEKEIDPEAILKARLAPDMLTFIHQIRIATDVAKGAASRLSETEVPVWEDNEESFRDVRNRIRKALDHFDKFSPGQFDGAEGRTITLELRVGKLEFSGAEYLLGFVLPNFYFHVSTAYNILRHNGLAIGKMDYLAGGRMPGQG